LFEHRLGALLGLTLDQVGALSVHEFDRWSRYWAQESWGPYRDNLHAAMICVQLLRPHLKDERKVPLISDFMLEPVAHQKERNASTFLHTLQSMARKPKKKA
jgi:hypothetical protein